MEPSHSRPATATPRLTDEEIGRLQQLFRESGFPDFPRTQVALTIARLLRFYHLCEISGQSAPPVSAIHTAVDKPPLARISPLSN